MSWFEFTPCQYHQTVGPEFPTGGGGAFHPRPEAASCSAVIDVTFIRLPSLFLVVHARKTSRRSSRMTWPSCIAPSPSAEIHVPFGGALSLPHAVPISPLDRNGAVHPSFPGTTNAVTRRASHDPQSIASPSFRRSGISNWSGLSRMSWYHTDVQHGQTYRIRKTWSSPAWYADLHA